ncbi:MAG: GCN5-related N-acetyltransferase [Bryobacterales bacterium]|nr:GCN5-related N-acetyltransferase [Bryobacterales bacterium]
MNMSPGAAPERVTIEGRYVTVAPLDAAVHAEALWEASRGPENDALWAYLPDGPFPDFASFQADLEFKSATTDPLFFAIVDRASGRATGRASFMRIEPRHRCVEVGGILYTPALQRTRGATEAMYLMARHAFEDLGYRRYEWKCNALNEPSRRAALRLGFTFEGIFRQHMIVKGRNRDTAWFAMLDSEWPDRKVEFERWLDPANFDAGGRQRSPLMLASKDSS